MPNESVMEVRIAELEADNNRLRQLLDQRDAPGELRHRLRSTIAMLRTIIRRTADSKRDIDSYVGHVEDRLDALMRAQAVTEENGSVDIRRLVTDELLHYRAVEGRQVSLRGPRIELKPRAGQVLGMAIHELAVNAVEHGPLGLGAGMIDISWDYVGEESDTLVTFVWKEVGLTRISPKTEPGFGTEVLTRMMKYEFNAETVLTIEPEGLLCSMRFPLTERIGWVEKEGS